MNRLHRKVWLCLLLSLLFPAVRAGEPPVKEGLAFWFQAAAQPGLREAAGLPGIQRMQPVDFVLDGMGGEARAMQPVPERRPVFVGDSEAAYLKFDGKDDFLGMAQPGRNAAEVTLFILAAPKSNPGFFTGMFGAAALGRNDYTSGLNFDFGPGPTEDLSVLNVEGAGAPGFRDLLTPGFFNAASRPFGDFHVFTVRAAAGTNGVEVFLDGFPGGKRERQVSQIGLDRIVIGGRIYSNDASQPPFAQGFFDGAIAEVALYERALSGTERAAVEKAMLARTVELNALLHGLKGHALETVENAPIAQMLVPGFTIEELPIEIGNLNNVRYRADGKLVGLGYDGRIHLLSDTDGDGLEDRSELFWDRGTLRSPIGMALTPPGDPRGDGIFVASKGKVSLILDTDRDGRADEEQVLATGWPELFHGVDTLGLAVDPKDGAIYFGLGCLNFADAYLIDRATGESRYRLDDIHGTIQRISPDYSGWETVCTGVRFTCALAFNREGDLFATDQEGATWLPNGNPLDELLHIQEGKHYGFPPRHPRHLPEVRDEPAVIQYGPQHQSTVGMVFNEGVHGGPAFGPAHWEGDALVSGAARGKLWRTRLAKTPLGYVGQNHLIASFGLILVDICVAPDGSLVAACHSGPPDWGTGPAGQGRLFKIRCAQPELPRPVLAWAAGPDEFRVAFDRPLHPADWADAAEEIKIEAGEHAGAGDRFELIRPGYQVVRDQMAAPRRWVRLLGLAMTEDRRTLVLRVPRQTEPVQSAITLPVPESWRNPGGIPQHPQIDVALSLNGVAAQVRTADGEALRTVLPHASLAASAVLTEGSAEHERFFRAAAQPGAVLELSGLADVSNPYVPAVQPGSKLDWDPAKDPFASKLFTLRTDHAGGELSASGGDAAGAMKAFELRVREPAAAASGLFLADGDLTHRLAPGRVLVPWAVEGKASEEPVLAQSRPDVTGDWLRGRRVFFGDGGCATCHTVRGQGMAFGPDLSNLVHRDRISVLQDILKPSATINPDHTGTLVKLDDGIEHAALVRGMTDESVRIALPAGVELDVPRGRILKMEPMKRSLMPEGLEQVLNEDRIEDLLAFLLTKPLEPAPITRVDPPPPAPRRMEEVKAVLGGAPRAPRNPSPLNILLCAGPKDHGLDEHDYPLWLARWERLLGMAENVTVKTAMGFPDNDRLAWADVAVFYNANPGWNGEKAAALDTFHEKGGGAVYIHYAVDGGKDPAGAAERMGLAFTLGSRFRHGEFDLVFTEPEHPITRGFPALHFTDETYWNMRGDVSRLNVLGTSLEDREPRPQLWTLERGKSRIVGCIPGHYTWTFDDPLFRVLVFRSICWAAREENPDRLAELSLVGARVAP